MKTPKSPHYSKHVFICTNEKAPGKTCCANQGGKPFYDYLKKNLKERKLQGPGKIKVSQSGCLGRCKLGPCIVVYPEGIWYHYATFSDINDIISRHLVHGEVVEHLLIDSME